MRDIELVAAYAIFSARRRGAQEITADDLLLGCLRAVSKFGIAEIGPWNIDLELLGVNWIDAAEGPPPKAVYSQQAVEIFDRAAQIAKSVRETHIGVNHVLAAFAAEESSLMAELKKTYDITSASWRAAIARTAGQSRIDAVVPAPGEEKRLREYLSPEEAANELGIHVQTMRMYVRSGRIPAFRVAGERALRILRSDLVKVLEPVEREK